MTTERGFGIETLFGDALRLDAIYSAYFDDNYSSKIIGANNGISVKITPKSNLFGRVKIGTNGRVVGLMNDGIHVDAASRMVEIVANHVQGQEHGIYAKNSGTGDMFIDTYGMVEGVRQHGIYAENAGNNLKVNSMEVSGNSGVSAVNTGTGALSILSKIKAIGTHQYGIHAKNSGTDLNITANEVYGDYSGIQSQNQGSGSLSIDAKNVVGNKEFGIYALNNRGTNLTIKAANVSGYNSGIYAYNAGTGSVNITTTQKVVGRSQSGVFAYNSVNGSDLIINVADAEGYDEGILAQNAGKGLLAITTTGNVVGVNGYGIEAWHSGVGDLLLNIDRDSRVEGKQGALMLRGSNNVNVINSGIVRSSSNLSSQQVVHTTSGVTTFSNYGQLVGSVSFAGSGNTFHNGADGTWDSSGGTNDLGSATGNFISNAGLLITANRSDPSVRQTTTFNNVNNFVNSGTISMANGRAGDKTVINGNYLGENGQVLFDGVLNGDDDSVVDTLVINGNVQGTTRVSVNNVGGRGALALRGIELIKVSGRSIGKFVQEGRIVAGAHDYFLQQGRGANPSSWYLHSSLQGAKSAQRVETSADATPAPDAASAPAPDAPSVPAPDAPSAPAPDVAAEPEVRRPEAAAYAGNLAAANNLLTFRLQDRLGQMPHLLAKKSDSSIASMWLRTKTGQTRSHDDSGQVKMRTDRYLVQLGGNIFQWVPSNAGKLNLGVMAGYGSSKSSNTANLTGYKADGKVDGYSVGLYATWYARGINQSGWYADTSLQYSWFDNKVSGQGLAEESYKSKGFTAAIEGGYAFKLLESGARNFSWFVQPQAQLVWQGVKADDHVEANGTRVSGDGDGNLQARLGVKTFLLTRTGTKGNMRTFQPFVEANWLYNSNKFASVMDGYKLEQDGTSNIAELKLGVDGQLTNQWDISGYITYQMGSSSYSDTAAQLAIKYHF
ncbi:autotransporter outer membrane beta-barrel domain-containing protein [Serratia microhaemolytica]|uniref:autotransporter outer membrane beta-barrel domain-containing protein n=1 Tax=Serratia microhaemolytica TaxID=2675110 RepID=UPI0013923D1C|nr:autotransporter outer membrane beta-barrel domain-containing protein [Serratia microhaemolytica]